MDRKKMAQKMLGKQHHLKPVTDSDHVMSKRHLRHRAEIDGMEKKHDKDREKILKLSIKYNKSHRKEHEKAEKKAEKELKKHG